MAFFRKGKKKKGNGIPEESKTPSAEIAKQRAEDIQSNYDSDAIDDELDRSCMEELPEDYTSTSYTTSPSEPEDLDPLLSGNLDDSMLSFEDEVEKDIENSEIGEAVTEEREEEGNHDFFADVELPEDTNGELSETDSTFKGLYNIDGDTLEESPSTAELVEEEDEEDENQETAADNEALAQSTSDDVADNEDLAQTLSDDIEEQLIENEDESTSSNGMATKSQIYMAMQVFDSETGEFDMKSVDNQLVFDTDDEDSFGFSCHKEEEESKPKEFDVDSYVFDTSDED